MKKILAVTTIRSDYDLMSGLYRALKAQPGIRLRLLCAGAHLSKTFGYSIDQVRRDGCGELIEIETLIDSDTKQSRLKSASILLQNSIDAVAAYAPDLIMYAGDREDVIVAALLGGYLEIPTMHFFGGDHVADGNIDNAVRHAASMLSTCHVVSLEEHKQRLIRMGESADRIFVTGSIALDKFRRHVPLSAAALRRRFGITEGFDRFGLVIFHPIAGERASAARYFECLLSTLAAKGINCFVSYPNTDPGNRAIIDVIRKWEKDRRFRFYRNLDRATFLSIYKRSRFIIGNSSSGIIESASVPVPAINVGLRQLGRAYNENVLFCRQEARDIARAVDIALSPGFRSKIRNIRNIYGDGASVPRAVAVIKKILARGKSGDTFIKKDPLDG